MLIMRFEDMELEIEVEEYDEYMKVYLECPCGCEQTVTFEVSHSDYEQMIEDGVIDTVEEDECICPHCRIESQIQELNMYLECAIGDCNFEDVRDITASIKNLMEIQEML